MFNSTLKRAAPLLLLQALTSLAYADHGPLHPGDLRLTARTTGTPLVEAQAGHQITGEGQVGATIRVMYQSAGVGNNSQCELIENNTWCGPRYFTVRGQITPVSGSSVLPQFNLEYVPIRVQQGSADHSHIIEYEFARAQLSRDIRIGKELRVRIDMFGFSSSYQNHTNTSDLMQFFVTANAHLVGVQHLLASGMSGADAQHYLGIDMGGASVEAGAVQRWTSHFHTRLTIGGAIDCAGVLAVGGSAYTDPRTTCEMSAYSRLSALLEERILGIEAYAQTAATALQIEDTATPSVRYTLELGSAIRF